MLLVVLTLGCAANIPREAPALSANVTKAIEALQQNALDLVDAWEIVATTTVSDQMEQIYGKAEAMYVARRQAQISGDGLTRQQSMEIAALASIIKDQLNQKVRDQAASMRRQVMQNAQTAAQMSRAVTDLLSSSRRVIEANEQMLSTIGDILPVPQGMLEVKPLGSRP